MVNINFSPFPILTTERLTLRQLSANDGQTIFALRSDPAINKYLGRQPSKTLEDALNFITSVNENIQQNNSVYWVITLTDTKNVVGTICLFDFSIEKNSCEIGYELMTKFQGQGMMKEAAAAVIDFAFETLQFQKIIAFTHNDNRNSTKLLEKLNFTKSVAADQEMPDFTIFTLTNSPNKKQD
ncbi:MAG: GNAT family N-acetyltransferase [Pedobacter sp.]|jgi:ribosomal-protein-alanine N-acetyltransferase|uniref:GNAT family N-acetyltransferase n=1 Tax=Pedobacter sp. TaxID=1411316 RepID=UPI003568ACA9